MAMYSCMHVSMYPGGLIYKTFSMYACIYIRVFSQNVKYVLSNTTYYVNVTLSSWTTVINDSTLWTHTGPNKVYKEYQLSTTLRSQQCISTMIDNGIYQSLQRQHSISSDQLISDIMSLCPKSH